MASQTLRKLPSGRKYSASKIPQVILILNKLQLSGDLKELFRLGVIDVKYKDWHEIFLMVDMEMRSGKNKTQAVQEVSVKCSIPERRIWNILSRLSW